MFNTGRKSLRRRGTLQRKCVPLPVGDLATLTCTPSFPAKKFLKSVLMLKRRLAKKEKDTPYLIDGADSKNGKNKYGLLEM